MKKLLKAFIMLLFVGCMLLFFAACGNGADILTDVTLEDDFSGSRVMNVSISKSIFNDYFAGMVEDLYKLIKENCPKELKFNVNETDSTVDCVFKLEFVSIDDYKEKVAAILGEDRDIVVVKADSFLSKGISYEESFTSEELLGWFSTALVDNGFVGASNKSDIFDSDSTTFIFDSKKYQSSTQIQVSDISYLPFGSIDILTRPYSDNTYDRTVVFHIPKSTIDEKGEEIEAFLKDGVPEQATTSWVTDDDSGDTVFTINMDKCTAKEIGTAMQSIFHSEEAGAESIPYTGETNILQFGQGLNETIDVTEFISGDNGTAYMRYYISSDAAPYAEKVYSDGSTAGVYGWNEDYEGYTCFFDDYISIITLNSYTKISYIPYAINVITQIKGRDNIERNIELIYSDDLEESEIVSLNDNIVREAKEYAEINYTKEDADYKINLKQSGAQNDINEGFEAIFNISDAYVHYARQKSKSAAKLASVFEEHIDFSDFLGNSFDDIELSYKLKLPRGEKISKSTKNHYTEDGTVTIQGNELKALPDNGIIDYSVVASKFNAFALLWWLLIFIFIIAVVLAIYMVVLKILDIRRNADSANMEAAAALVSKAARQVLHKKQCPACKAYIDEHVKFCTKCGVKLMEDNSNYGE